MPPETKITLDSMDLTQLRHAYGVVNATLDLFSITQFPTQIVQPEESDCLHVLRETKAHITHLVGEKTLATN